MAVLGSLAWPQLAWAAGGGPDTGTLTTVVLLVVIIGGAYLLTHYVVDWLQRLFLIATNIEYLLLGLLVGLFVLPGRSGAPLSDAMPDQTSFFTWPRPLEDLTMIAPLIALAAGWTGLIYGMSLRFSSIFDQRDGALRLAVIEGLFTALPVAVASYAVFSWAFTEVDIRVQSEPLMLCAGTLGVTAWAGSTSAMDLIQRRYTVDNKLLDVLTRGAQFSDVLAIVAFGVLFATFHDVTVPELGEGAPLSRVPTSVEWVVITLGLGAALGALFAWFLDDDDSDAGRLLALSGIIAVASGAAFFLDLSGLTINMVLGMMLINLSRSGQKVKKSIEGTYRPITLLLLLLAGALWTAPPIGLTALLVVVVLVVRLGGKVFSGWVGSIGVDIRSDVFRGTIGQGDVAIAMAVSFKLVYDIAMGPELLAGPARSAIDATYTAILITVVVHEIVAPRLLKGLLVDAGGIREESAPGE